MKTKNLYESIIEQLTTAFPDESFVIMRTKCIKDGWEYDSSFLILGKKMPHPQIYCLLKKAMSKFFERIFE